jgi:hypothetical protein
MGMGERMGAVGSEQMQGGVKLRESTTRRMKVEGFVAQKAE